MPITAPTNNVIVLCWTTPASTEDNAMKIAEFLGTEATVVSVATALDADSVRRLVPCCTALIVHVETLLKMAETLKTDASDLLSLINSAKHLFIYGFKSTERHSPIVTTLSSGGLIGIEPLPAVDSTFAVSNLHRECCGQFSGVSVQGVDRTREAGFVERASREQQGALIRAAGRPFLVRIDHGGLDLFLVACGELGDLDEKVPSKAGLLPWFSRVVPLMMFLRSALGNRLWHGDRSQACFIIDDPLLKERYGFLKYASLLEAIEGQKFCASIGFIPWNYRRSHKRVIEMFSNATSPLSLCVHGCDHTRGEFASTSYELLRDKSKLALDRMHAHRELSGLRFDDAMVFPQGLFSAEAIKALNDCGYLAAVNTDPCTSNTPPALTLRDLLDVSVTRFEGFPVFVRHYPQDVAEFAFDLFLGKPALVVEHHNYFRNGYEDLIAFVKRLNSLDSELEWSNLTAICSRACLKRVTPTGDVHVKFYTNRFRLTNGGTQRNMYALSRQWSSDGPLPHVTMNGREWRCEQLDDKLTMSVALDPGETADIWIVPERTTDASLIAWKPTNMYGTKVLVRRVLSEIRDNYIETNRLMSALLSEVRKLRTRTRRRQASLMGSAN